MTYKPGDTIISFGEAVIDEEEFRSLSESVQNCTVFPFEVTVRRDTSEDDLSP